ncbi:MAG TPA: copper transporter, partial [Myxococcaceae bacterium]
MNFDKLLKILASVALAAIIGLGVRASAGDEKKEPAKAPAPEKAAPAARTVELKVTDKGFEPTPVKVKKGEPIRLRITR